MSINNLSKDIVLKLFEPLANIELSESQIVDKIKSDAANYAKLKLLAEQAQLLKAQIKNVIDEGLLNSNLHDIECRFIKVSGNTYHLYKKNDGTYYFSMIAPDEWTIKDEFIKSYLYDYDKCFKML